MRRRLQGCSSPWRSLGVAGGAALSLAAAAAAAQDSPTDQQLADNNAGPRRVEDLSAFSIDQLAQLRVTSVSRRPQAVSAAPGAIFVITAEDIRRSGATSLPEVLRMAPNLEVARINAYDWTITARGFNSPESANKLLVLIDGRSVYEPIGGGVLWQQVSVSLENIDRIEVISGPGGTLWGANAVNGVINVILKSGQATKGPFLDVGGGGFERTGAFSFGGALGDHASFRVFANAFDFGATHPALASDGTDDAFRGVQAGGRVEGAFGAESFAVKGTAYSNQIADGGGNFEGETLLGRWAHAFAGGGSAELQAYFDNDVRKDPSLYESRQTFDIQVQDSFAGGARRHIVWGGEYRLWREDFVSNDAFFFASPRTTISLGSAFIEDEEALAPTLDLTAGLKLEYNSYSGLDWLPNLKVSWRPSDASMFWAAVSRAVRTPNRIERELEDPGFLVPAPEFRSEELIALEAGWRGEPSARLSLSVSTFYNLYSDLRTDEFIGSPFPIRLRNDAYGDTYGVEVWGKYQLASWWRLSAGANWLRKDLKVRAGFVDITDLQVGGQDPAWQAQIRSQMDLGRDVEFDTDLRGVDHVGRSPVPGYVEADARLGWRIRPHVEVALEGFNLLHEQHIEVWAPSSFPPRAIPRSVFARVRWGF